MRSKAFASVLSAIILTATLAQADSVSALGGPANYPPTTFNGTQFVDDRGCVFLRVGYGNVVNWVPRVTASHQPLCGQTPTFGAAPQVTIEPQIAPAPHVTIAPQVALAPVTMQPTAVTTKRPSAPTRRITAPRPAVIAPRTVVATRYSPVIPTPPRGYKLAWKDDRLNPLRGIGTALGQAQQDEIWTRTAPMHLVTGASTPGTFAIRISITVTAPTGPHATFVQISTFGQSANALSAQTRLTALGLPASTRQIIDNGRIRQVVVVGPFATAALAQSALTATKAAGFPDAILR